MQTIFAPRHKSSRLVNGRWIPFLPLAVMLLLGGCVLNDKGDSARLQSPGSPQVSAAAGAGSADTSGPSWGRLARNLNGIATAAGDNGGERLQVSAVVQRLGDEAMAVFSDPAATVERRMRAFQRILQRDFDVSLIARFVLGPRWRRIPEAQRRSYVQAFSQFLVHTYAVRLGNAGIDRFTLLDTRRVGRKDWVVRTEIVRGSDKVQANWRLRKREGRFRVIDVVVAGVSMAVTHRQEFASIIRSNGGNVATLIAMLERRGNS